MYVFTTVCLKKKYSAICLFTLSHIEGLTLVRLITVLSQNISSKYLSGNSYKLSVWGNILINFVYVVRKNSLTQYTHNR